MPSSAFDVECPVCRATLTVSPEARSVIAHKAAPTPRAVEDLDQGLRSLEGEGRRRDTLFQKSVESEKNKGDRLKKSFDDLLKRAQDDPDQGPPARDIDLD